MLTEGTGEFYNQTLYSPKDKPVISLKENKPANKYGGYSNENMAYFIIYSYVNKKNIREYVMTGIPIKISYDIKNNKEKVENYIIKKELKNIEYSDFKIVKNHILKNQQYLDENNEPMRLCSHKEIRADKELIVNQEMNELIYFVYLDESKLKDEQKEKLENGYIKLFNYLLEKLEKEYKIFSNIHKKILDNYKKFEELSDVDKKLTIKGMISLMKTGQGNLKAVGLSDREGRMNRQTFKTDRLLKMTFVDKSVTGMYERRYKLTM